MFILLLGNLTVGYHAVGPFYSYPEAYSYAASHVADGLWHIFTVHKPEQTHAPNPKQPPRAG